MMGRITQNNLPALEHISARGNRESHQRILFDQQDGGPALVDGLDDVKDTLHQDRRQPHRRLIQQQQARMGHDGASHCQHLLLAAREGPRNLTVTLLETREQGEDFLQVLFGFLTVGDAGLSAQVQVFGHPQTRKDAASLRHHRHAHRHDVVRLDRGQVPPFEADRALAGFGQAADAAERGGLARAIRANQRHDFAFFDREGNALQGMDIPVVGMNVRNFKHRHVIPRLRLVLRHGLPQVGFDDAWIVLDLGRAAFGDFFAVVQHGDTVTNTHDHAHVVLD